MQPPPSRFIAHQSINSPSESYLQDLQILQPSDYQPLPEQQPIEEQFLNYVYCLKQQQGRPVRKAPRIGGADVDLYQLFLLVQQQGGYNKVANWRQLAEKIGVYGVTNAGYQFRVKYEEFLLPCEKLLVKKFWASQMGEHSDRSERRICQADGFLTNELSEPVQMQPPGYQQKNQGLRKLRIVNYPFTFETLKQMLNINCMIEDLELGNLNQVVSFEGINLPRNLRRLVLYKVNKEAAMQLMLQASQLHIQDIQIDIAEK